jgi:hypothetical protein
VAYRVIQWATGGTGKNALRQILRHPELELVGVWVHSQTKVGLDAASLCDWPEPTSVFATNDVSAILELDADCVSYMRTNPYYPVEADERASEVDYVIDEICQLLRSGKSVISITTLPLVWPPMLGDATLRRLEQACEAGRSSFRATGICPGFYTDALPLALSGLSERVDAVHYIQLLNYSTYQQPTRMRMLGFGVRPEELAEHDPKRLEQVYGPGMLLMADAFGVEIEGFRETMDYRVTDEAFEIAVGWIHPGTIEAIRMRLEGIVEGRAVFVNEIVSRLRNGSALDWPHMDGREGFRVIIEGEPSLKVDLDIGAHDGNGIQITLDQTAALAVNDIPNLCAASPGVHSFLDSRVTTATVCTGPRTAATTTNT